MSPSERPLALDCLDVLPGVPDRAALATELLVRAAPEFGAAPGVQPEDCQTAGATIPPSPAAVAWRTGAATAAGLTDAVERLRV